MTYCVVRTGRLVFPWVVVCLARRELGRQQSILSTHGEGETVRVEVVDARLGMGREEGKGERDLTGSPKFCLRRGVTRRPFD